ncbi:MAG TPA: maleylpyruvate isomerase family mycothiol-dependent enzyme [Acidimicrobiales bacterium]|nr:maleylpyruvate isomerase family mycothiol-dependent enzyme [Acidimicrobiales bacterium]
MDVATALERIAIESRALAGVGPLDAGVASCPGWSVADVVRHTGGVHRWMLQQITADDPTQLRREPVEPAPEGEALGRWLTDGAAALVQGIAADPDRVCPTFRGPMPASWWARRALHETTVHRWDAEAAVGVPGPIDPEQAADGIDELLAEIAPRRLDRARFPVDVTLHFHATDVTGEWLVDLGPERFAVRPGHAKGDVAARGPAADLFLLVWARIPAARLEVFGDATLLDRWHDAADF